MADYCYSLDLRKITNSSTCTSGHRQSSHNFTQRYTSNLINNKTYGLFQAAAAPAAADYEPALQIAAEATIKLTARDNPSNGRGRE